MSALYHHRKTKCNTNTVCQLVYVLLALYKLWPQIQPKINRKCLQPNISRKKIRLAEPQPEKSTDRSFVTKKFRLRGLLWSINFRPYLWTRPLTQSYIQIADRVEPILWAFHTIQPSSSKNAS